MNLMGVRLTWLGHASFRIETPAGKTIYVDPWVMGNPMCPENDKAVTKVDALFCTHGHQDHIGDAVTITKHCQPVIVGIYELCAWMQKKGAQQISPMNKGGTQTVAGVKVTMVHADHSAVSSTATRLSTAARPSATSWSLKTASRFITREIPMCLAIWPSFAISMRRRL